MQCMNSLLLEAFARSLDIWLSEANAAGGNRGGNGCALCRSGAFGSTSLVAMEPIYRCTVKVLPECPRLLAHGRK